MLSVFKKSSQFQLVLVSILVVGWFLVHVPMLNYGTESLPIHAAYVGDEQGPINGALHILADRSLFALRGAYNTQYGPVISVVAIVPVLIEYGEQKLQKEIISADDFKNSIIWNWSGILYKARLVALLTSILGFVALYFIVKEVSGSIANYRKVGLFAILLLATNFHFFIYAGHFRHWIFVVTILLWQVLLLIWIRNGDGKQWWPWIASATLASISFGISYFGIFFLILWLPSLIEWLMRHDWNKLIKFLTHGLLIALATALIVAWVPGPFFRAIGIGYGDISGQGIEEHITEDYGQQLSFSYYLEVIGLNNAALIIALLLLCVLLWRGKYSFDKGTFYSISLAAFGYYVFFSLQSHHEPRYILPTIVLLVALVVFAFTVYFKNKHTSSIFWYRVIVALLCFQMLFHSVHIARMLGVYNIGNTEQEMLSNFEPFMAEYGGQVRVLALRDNLLGHPHTRESYANYANRFNFSNRGLFATLQTEAVYPTDMPLLDVDYFSYFHLPVDEAPSFSDYDVIIARHRPNEPDVPNNRDLVDVNMMNHWYPNIWREQYFILFTSEQWKEAYENPL